MSWRQGGVGGDDWRTDGGNDGSRRSAQPTVLVSSTVDDLPRCAPSDLLSDSVRPGDGIVVVTTGDPEPPVARLLGSIDGCNRSDVAVVTTGDSEVAAATTVGLDPAPTATAMADAVADGFDALGDGRAHLLVDRLAAAGTDEETVYRRAHEIAMAVGAEPGLTVVGVDATDRTEAFVERLTHLFDVHVRLRRDGERCQARWTALTGTSDGWHAWSEVDVCRMRPV